VIYSSRKCPALIHVAGAGFAIMITISGCATSKDISSLDTSDSAIPRLGPKPEADMTLISNQEMTNFYLVSGDQKIPIGKGKIVPVKVDSKVRYEIVAHPVGYSPMSLFTTVPPPYELRFTFHISDRDGSVPDYSHVLPPVNISGLKIYNPPGTETLALLPTQSDEKPGGDQAVGDGLNHLFSESKAFALVERDRIRDAITELNFQQSDLVDQDNALKMGKLLGANYILISSVSRPGGGRKQVFARRVSVKTGQQVATAIAECQGEVVPIPTLIQVVNKINASE
jgi:hypothetical protein